MVDHPTAALLERSAKEALVVTQDGRVAVPQPLEQLRRPLDVREEKRGRTAQLTAHAVLCKHLISLCSTRASALTAR